VGELLMEVRGQSAVNKSANTENVLFLPKSRANFGFFNFVSVVLQKLRLQTFRKKVLAGDKIEYSIYSAHSYSLLTSRHIIFLCTSGLQSDSAGCVYVQNACM
jgi:hypothetical protein